MSVADQLRARTGAPMDIILFQRIGGRWEYHYTAQDGEKYVGEGEDHADARARLRARLGWTGYRFDRANFRRF